MPWTMDDYPASLKNLDKPVKKKAIEIANALVDEGYDESRAIPIATSQAKEWHENASKREVKDFMKNDDPTKRDSDASHSNPDLIDNAEEVVPHEEGWAVQAKGSKRPSQVFDNKQDAVKRAKEIAKNKGTETIIHKKDGSVEKRA
ncbi:Uncharacterized protein YdaT [Terribacillus halophilus]|uniref:Uncharacterized protein YdaT n=1 Tax=Terribacillus halophilus TaxID=361279 RepID=A0A1G6HXW0_9BACI|nr:DUF2188 domain-containing protein [Terribacillus halophilus]SDB99139.1 Uncharacterized protein YdaT [Terribacillus halophilus]